MTELRERFADMQRQHLNAENELINAQGEIREMHTKYDAALLKLEQRDISHERMTAELEGAHAEIEQWKTEHSALGQCVIDQQMEILRIKQKAVSNLEEVQYELANLQNRYDTLDRSHTVILTETRRGKDIQTPNPMFTEVRAPGFRRLDSPSEWEWPSPAVDPPVVTPNPDPYTPKIDITIASKEFPQQQPSTSKFPLDRKENTTKSETNPAIASPGILLRAKSFKSKSKTAKVSVRATISEDKENQGAKDGKGSDLKVPWVLIKTDSEDARESENENDTTKERK
ncbi:hypothetical protein BJ322DRAFT_1033052 [Thelephora terrestris]|uniref:Uncharacterized protein n=1 Tax=Thelephora terrestris TaxID=56493 RepID=A0A9P6LC93_9AGAM|nr:hypothetical protein BJ322DRAFT_1033052 [Thelephora terrestris]